MSRALKRCLEEAAEGLADFPEAGRAAGATRLLVTVRPYVIRYRVRPDAIVVVGVASWSQGALNVVPFIGDETDSQSAPG